MSVRLIESGVAVGLGAAHSALAVPLPGKIGPGGMPWSLYMAAGATAAGAFGRRIGVPENVREPLLYGGLALLGARAAWYATQGVLMTPQRWRSVGGDIGGDDGGVGGAAVAPVGMQPQRRLGGYPTYPPTAEAPGIAG